MKKNIIEIVTTILAFIMIIVPIYIAPICPANSDGSHMGCYYSANLTTKLSIAVVLISLIMIFTSRTAISKIIKIIGSILNIFLAFLIYAIPHRLVHVHNEVGKLYGFCGSDSMPCVHHHTFEILGFISLIIGILMILNLIKTFLSKR